MNESEIYTTLSTVFADVFDDESFRVTPELSAKDVDGWDSLSHLRLILTVEKAFHIRLKTSEIGRFENVSDLVRVIQARLAAG
jgi:acyl carrier protein